MIDGHISLGTFLAFNTYLLQLAAPARMLSGLLSAGQMARAGAVRILELLDTPSEVVEPARRRTGRRRPGRHRLRGRAVRLRRPRRRRSGGRCSTASASGSSPASGSPWSGPAARASRPSPSSCPGSTTSTPGGSRSTAATSAACGWTSCAARSGIVFEDAFLFSASIADNIAFGAPGATPEQIRAAARAAEADGFIEALPDGYDTVVGERGLTLSGGQRQRVTLARALVTDPKILVLDDATSAVDPTVEAEIHATLRRLMADRTTIVVAHRRSTISLADRIVVVDGGRVLAEGTHDELMATCPRYVELLTGAAPEGEPTSPAADDAVGDSSVRERLERRRGELRGDADRAARRGRRGQGGLVDRPARWRRSRRRGPRRPLRPGGNVAGRREAARPGRGAAAG